MRNWGKGGITIFVVNKKPQILVGPCRGGDSAGGSVYQVPARSEERRVGKEC